jgi:hypothetical protein
MPDIERSGVLILWGYNPSFTRLSHATAVVAALKRGIRLIVVDPRHVGLAGKADQLASTGVTLEQLRAAPGGVRMPLRTRHTKHAESDGSGAARLRDALAPGRALLADLPRSRLRAFARVRRAAHGFSLA